MSVKVPAEFDDIRPFNSEELPEVFDRLLADETVKGFIKSFKPRIPYFLIKMRIKSCKTNLEFQKKIVYPIVENSWKNCTTDCTFDYSATPDKNKRYTFVSNHRDIVLDSAYLSGLLKKYDFPTTVEIAIGDNLLIKPWIKDLVRINKSFIVQRSLTGRELLMASKRMSEYMHFAVTEKQENLWIAQREGRAKDSNDRTQDAVLKMLAMGGKGTPIESLKELNIVPLAISYEYDPCDYLKAKEFQQKRDNPDFKKSKEDDLLNMATGIKGFKGEVHYCTAPCINEWIDELAELPKTEFFTAVAQRMDKEIHLRYRLYPCNYIAADMLNNTTEHQAHYTDADKAKFEYYLQERLGLIDLPNKDEAFLKKSILTMYANPVFNQLAAQV